MIDKVCVPLFGRALEVLGTAFDRECVISDELRCL